MSTTLVMPDTLICGAPSESISNLSFFNPDTSIMPAPETVKPSILGTKIFIVTGWLTE
jgi:hypothetical protein